MGSNPTVSAVFDALDERRTDVEKRAAMAASASGFAMPDPALDPREVLAWAALVIAESADDRRRLGIGSLAWRLTQRADALASTVRAAKSGLGGPLAAAVRRAGSVSSTTGSA